MPRVVHCKSCSTPCALPEGFTAPQFRCPQCGAVGVLPARAGEEPLTVLPASAAIASQPVPPLPTPDGVAPRPPAPRTVAKSSGPPVLLVLGVVALVLFLGCGLTGAIGVFSLYSWRQARMDDERLMAEELDFEHRHDDRDHGGMDPEEARRLREQREEEFRRDQERRAQEAREQQARVEEQQRQEEQRRLEDERNNRVKGLARPLADVKIPEAIVGSETFSVQRMPGKDVTWSVLPFGAPPAGENDPRRTALVAGVAWADDGNSFYALGRHGVLRHVAYPGLKEIRKVDLSKPCDALAVCKFGLLLTLQDLQEVWLVHPETFRVTKRFGVNKVRKVLTGPTLEYAYVFAGAREVGDAEMAPCRLALADGGIAAMVPTNAPGLVLGGGFEHANLTPDGKLLFADDGNLLRYEIDGLKLTLKGASHKGMGGGHKEGICISPDSQWVCFPTGGGNDDANYATYLYRTDDLSKPAFVMKQGAYPEIVGFDPAGRRFFSQNRDHWLMVFDEKGTERGAYRFGSQDGGGHAVKQYAAHPRDGKTLLLRASQRLLLIESGNASTTPQQVPSLSFGNGTCVELADSAGLIDPNRPFTVEAWVKVPQQPRAGAAMNLFGDGSDDNTGWGVTVVGSFRDPARTMGTQWQIHSCFGLGKAMHNVNDPNHGWLNGGQWTHIAVVKTETTVALFVNGGRRGPYVDVPGPLKVGSLNLRLGSKTDGKRFGTLEGEMRAFRLSSGALYERGFMPPQPFTREPSTLVLLDFPGEGDTLKDLAGKHPGKLTGGTWTRADLPLPPPPPVAVKELPADLMTLTSTRKVDVGINLRPYALVFAPDSQALYVGGNGGKIRKLSPTTGLWMTPEIVAQRSTVMSVSLSADGKRIASRDSVWDDTGKVVLAGQDSDLFSRSALSPDGKQLVYGAQKVRLIDVPSRKERAVLQQGKGWAETIIFSPDGKMIATAAFDCVKLWNAETGAELATLKGHTGPAMGLAFSPDSKTLATAGSDKIAVLWDVATKQKRLALEGHQDPLSSVAFAPDGKLLLTGAGGIRFDPGHRGEAILWDAVTGKPIGTLKGHTDGVSAVAWAADGTTLATCASDGTILFWTLPKR